MKSIFFTCLSLTCILLFSSCNRKQTTTFVSIGTGGISGVYYPIGGHLSKLLNDNVNKYGIKASYESTGGSVVNINSILAGDFDFGIAQADRQYQAANGLAEWASKGVDTNLRVVVSLHAESVTLVASVKSEVMKFMDIKGKRVNIGNPGSGHRQNALDCLSAYEMDPKVDLKVQSVKASEAPSLIRDERIDAFFYTVGHPNGALKEVTSQAIKVRFIDIPATDALLSKNPYYSPVTIDMSHYPNADNEADVNTIGVRAALVTSASTDEKTVYVLTKLLLDNFETFKTIHPSLMSLTREQLTQDNVIPFHKGATKAFKEAGFMAP